MYLLEVKQLNKVCSEDISLKDISFAISDKGVYGFLAKSGSGNSELASVLSGVSETDGANVFYKDKELYANENQTAAIRRKIGYVPAKCSFAPELFAFEVLDLMGKARRVDPDKRFRQIKEALSLVGLSDKGETFVSALAPSEKKRLMIACALIGNPDVIIMDDPFRSIEKKQAEEIRSLLRMLGKRKTVLFFSSRVEEIEECCDNIAILHKGRLVLWEEKSELLAKLKKAQLGGLADAFAALTEDKTEEEN